MNGDIVPAGTNTIISSHGIKNFSKKKIAVSLAALASLTALVVGGYLFQHIVGFKVAGGWIQQKVFSPINHAFTNIPVWKGLTYLTLPILTFGTGGVATYAYLAHRKPVKIDAEDLDASFDYLTTLFSTPPASLHPTSPILDSTPPVAIEPASLPDSPTPPSSPEVPLVDRRLAQPSTSTSLVLPTSPTDLSGTGIGSSTQTQPILYIDPALVDFGRLREILSSNVIPQTIVITSFQPITPQAQYTLIGPSQSGLSIIEEVEEISGDEETEKTPYVAIEKNQPFYSSRPFQVIAGGGVALLSSYLLYKSGSDLSTVVEATSSFVSPQAAAQIASQSSSEATEATYRTFGLIIDNLNLFG